MISNNEVQLNNLTMDEEFNESPLNMNLKSDQKSISFDQILSLIGFGWYQYHVYFVIILLAITEGAQIQIFTLMIPVLDIQWNISNQTNSIQASLVFISFLCGSMISGQIADLKGRKYPIIISSSIVVLIGGLQSLSPNIEILIFLRVVCAVLIGFFGPIGATICAEITPSDMRGKCMTIITMAISLGQIYGIAVGMVFLKEDLKSGNWRLLIIFGMIPAYIACFFAFKTLDESARFELSIGNHERAFEILQNMSIANKGQKLDPALKDYLVVWSNNIAQQQLLQERASIRALFKGQSGKITLIIWFNWFTTTYVYYGILIFFPLIIERLNTGTKYDQDSIIQILLSTISEIFGVLLAASLIEIKIFGRKNSMILFYSLAGGASFLTYTFKNEFVIWATVCKFLIAITMIFCFQYTSEVYTTKQRTTGIGMANGIGRLGGVFMPWICYFLFDIHILLPFLSFMGLSIAAGLLSTQLPFDTTGLELDSDKSLQLSQN